jgi:heme oxygenase
MHRCGKRDHQIGYDLECAVAHGDLSVPTLTTQTIARCYFFRQELEPARQVAPKKVLHPEHDQPQLPLRSRLRAATADLHDQVDASFQALDLRQLVGYRLFLQASAEALVSLESGLENANVARYFPNWEFLRRSDAISTDLSSLGGKYAQLPAMVIRDLGAVLGAMYVLEGSRLGARTLLPIVLGSPDPRVRQATSYLSHGEREPLWQNFLKELQRLSGNLTDTDSAIASAQSAFRLFGLAAKRHKQTDCAE